MKSFEEKLEKLKTEAIEKLISLIERKGVKSKFSNSKVLKIKSDNLMFNLSGGRYLVEVAAQYDYLELVDNEGYTYNSYVLNFDDFISVVDHLIAVNKKK